MARQRPVVHDGQVFESVAALAQHLKRPKEEVRKFVQSSDPLYHRFGWAAGKQLSDMKNIHGKYRIVVDKDHFNSFEDAAAARGVSPSTIRYRVESDYFPEYYVEPYNYIKRE